jgi:hypothetical protein
VDAVAEVMPLTVGGGNGTTQLAVTPQNGDGKNGCNLSGATTLGLSVSSSDISVARSGVSITDESATGRIRKGGDEAAARYEASRPSCRNRRRA